MIVTAPTETAVKIPEKQPLTMVAGQNDRMAGSVPVWDSISSFAENLAQSNQKDGKDDSFGLSDVIDMINPLQHIPIVSNFYQSATGDTMGSIAQIVGGALFGGPIGALASAGMVALQSAKSDKDANDLNALQGTTIALADLRAGYKPYNT